MSRGLTLFLPPCFSLALRMLRRSFAACMFNELWRGGRTEQGLHVCFKAEGMCVCMNVSVYFEYIFLWMRSVTPPLLRPGGWKQECRRVGVSGQPCNLWISILSCYALTRKQQQKQYAMVFLGQQSESGAKGRELPPGRCFLEQCWIYNEAWDPSLPKSTI